MRPPLLIGFAAETENVIENGKRKLSKCDWVIANDVSQGIFGSDNTQVHFITPDACETWPPCQKNEVAKKLVARCEGALT
jgi:phosphopantothenoylcysteine decarboxylase/phosphopantothenate--cysteine ligase